MAEPQTLTLRVSDHGRKVERVLAKRLERAPDHVSKLLRQERVWLEQKGRPARALRPGDLLPGHGRLVVRPPQGDRPPPQPNKKLRLKVLEEDEALVVLDKPAGLPAHPGPGHGTDTLLNALVARFPELVDLGSERGYGLVHRLDMGTSGLMVVARTAESYDALRAAFSERRVRKRYRALARGRLPDEGQVDLPVAGKEARSRFRIAQRAGEVLQVELWPETGRTHQLRLHLAAQGAPVLGDERHGAGRDELTAKLYLTRLALHAEELCVPHPLSGEERCWQSEWPRALRKAWKRAEKLAAD